MSRLLASSPLADVALRAVCLLLLPPLAAAPLTWQPLHGRRGGLGDIDGGSTPAPCRIEIRLEPRDISRLRTHPREDVTATVLAADQEFKGVALHLKGSTGSFRPVDDKPSFTLDFSGATPMQSFQGSRKIHLNNSVEDATYLKEQLGTELFRAANIPAPRVSHARLKLNGRPLGLYVSKEGFTDDFIARHFAGPCGNLYDAELGHDVDVPMKRHLGKGSDADNNQADLRRLASAAADADLSRRWHRMGQAMDIDRFLSFMAVEVLACHWDGYCLARNNFRVYHDVTTDRLVFLPSGMDQLFGNAQMPWNPDMAGVVARALMAIPEGQQSFESRFRALFETVFDSSQINRRVDQLLKGIRPLINRAEFNHISREVAELRAQITAREADLRRQLSAPAPTLLDFTSGTAQVAGWWPRDTPAGGDIGEIKSPEGRLVLRIEAGPRTSASWRSTVRLAQGHYGFQAAARVTRVGTLPFGKHHGASLRVAGKPRRSNSLIRTTDWETLTTEFDVSEAEEVVVLICELRGESGEAWFDKDSLRLTRYR